MTMEQAVGLAASRPYEMYASAVARDPTDFVSWSKLLAVVEDGETGERVSEAFEGFLAKFPLCFGYWCKYADMQPRLWSGIGREQVLERTTAIYERAVRAVPLSVELWKSYCAHLKGSTPILDASHIERLRETYERAVLSVGRDAQAAALWDSFLEFEADNGSPETVCRLYRRMVGEDSTGRTDELWRRFKLLCSSFRTSELVSGDEARELLSRYRTAKKLEAVDDPRGSQLAGYTELAEQQQLEQMLAEAEAAKNESIQRRLERQPFEAGVRRWYFHVKPLDEAQLQNWRDYLGREIERAKGVSEKDELERAKTDVQRLFERCLVPCALYAEFWIKYAYWMWRSKGVEAAVTVIERAATIYLPKRVDIMECYALLLEAARRIGDARAVYHAIFDRTVADPAQRASCAVARANFERRQHNRANVLDAYRDTLERAEPGFEAVAAHAARYLVRVAHDLDAARTLLDSALTQSPQAALWLARVQLELSRLHDDRLNDVHDAVAEVFERALADDAATADKDKFELWARYSSFANDFGYDAAALLSLKRRYAAFRRKRDAAAAASFLATPPAFAKKRIRYLSDQPAVLVAPDRDNALSSRAAEP